MKKTLSLTLALFLLLFTVGCGAPLPSEDGSVNVQTLLPDLQSARTVELTHYSCQGVVTRTLNAPQRHAWKQWVRRLCVTPISEETLYDVTMRNGGETYSFIINNSEWDIAYLDHGREHYLLIGNNGYRVSDGTVPPV